MTLLYGSDLIAQGCCTRVFQQTAVQYARGVNHLRFSDPELSAALETALKDGRAWERAVGHNVIFDERVSDGRRSIVEVYNRIGGRSTTLGEALELHYRNKITNGTELPPTFNAVNDLANYDGIDTGENLHILRLENLTWPIENWIKSTSDAAATVDIAALEAALFAHDAGTATIEQQALIDKFLDYWNDESDLRPRFAAFEALPAVAEDAQASDWVYKLRARFGLAHYDPPPGRRFLVALMRYTAAEVARTAREYRGQTVQHPFCAPTVLDSGNWAYFFPAPSKDDEDSPVEGGRALSLVPLEDWNGISAEFLHFRMPYKRQHIYALSWLDQPVTKFPLVRLRNGHLDVLRVACLREQFGEMMPDDLREG